jgi:hypothetical protein
VRPSGLFLGQNGGLKISAWTCTLGLKGQASSLELRVSGPRSRPSRKQSPRLDSCDDSAAARRRRRSRPLSKRSRARGPLPCCPRASGRFRARASSARPPRESRRRIRLAPSAVIAWLERRCATDGVRTKRSLEPRKASSRAHAPPTKRRHGRRCPPHKAEARKASSRAHACHGLPPTRRPRLRRGRGRRGSWHPSSLRALGARPPTTVRLSAR